MDMALDTGIDYAADLGQRLETILRRGHLYQNVAASINSNVHNGDRIYVTYNVTYNTSSGHDFMPLSTDQLLLDASSDNSAQAFFELKRKRALDDIGEVARKGASNNQRSLEIALTSLGDFREIAKYVEKAEGARKMAAFLSTILGAMQRAGSCLVLPENIKSRIEDLSHQLERTNFIKVNETFPLNQMTLLSEENRREYHVSTGNWQLSLITNSEETLHPYYDQICSILYAQPLHDSAGSPVAALFSETIDADQVTSVHPTVLWFKKPNPLYCYGATYETPIQYLTAHARQEIAEALDFLFVTRIASSTCPLWDVYEWLYNMEHESEDQPTRMRFTRQISLLRTMQFVFRTTQESE